MRIVATADTHFPFSADKIPDGDVFIHAGDLMYTGYPDEWDALVDSLAALPHKTKLYVPGNHDFHLENYAGIARAQLRRRANVTVLVGSRNSAILPNGYIVSGVPHVEGLEGWAFAKSNEELQDHMYLGIHPQSDIIVSHSPVWRILDAPNPNEPNKNNYGSLAMNHWFYNSPHRVKHWISGHIHESYGTTEVEGCKFYNVAMCDSDYNQTNEPMVIDL